MASVIALAGLVYEAKKAREVTSVIFSYESVIPALFYGVVLFVLNAAKLKSIELNVGRFEFDRHSFSGTMYCVKDRSRVITQLVGLEVVAPPEK